MHPAKTKSDTAVDTALSLILQEKNDEDSQPTTLLVRHIESPAKVAEHRQKLNARSHRSS